MIGRWRIVLRRLLHLGLEMGPEDIRIRFYNLILLEERKFRLLIISLLSRASCFFLLVSILPVYIFFVILHSSIHSWVGQNWDVFFYTCISRRMYYGF
ncbi:hypothetical protein L218DRAFT_71597 [Marasmius fiardii PR-910]|nr:hypothetical protein L218DRAFT_71597 [Marasmius fiardii PR-910]